MWTVATLTAKPQNGRLARARLIAARSATEAELRLLQAQIHPHFVFNTQATLQHPVDKRDQRAAEPRCWASSRPLAEIAQSVAHYLAIMQCRMGERLQPGFDIDPRYAQQSLPPGLLLSLVENPIEHDLEPKIGGGRLQLAVMPAGGCASPTTASAWRKTPDASDNHGLANLRQRLQHHFGARAAFTLRARPEGGTRVEIRFEEYQWLEQQPELCYLDIRMPGLSGIEVAQKIAGRSAVVFVTAYGDHALQAFDAGAVDHLVKPVDAARLAQAAQRVQRRPAAGVAALPGLVQGPVMPAGGSSCRRIRHSPARCSRPAPPA
ncbi:MAG: response regulator [Inhella sp.]